MDVRLVGARDRQPHRLGAGGEQQRVVGDGRRRRARHARCAIDARDFGCSAASRCLARDRTPPGAAAPIFRRAAREIVLRQIGPVEGRRGVVAQHDDAAAKIAPPQHLRGGKTGRAAADDDDLAGRIGRAALPRGFGCSRFRRTKIRPSRCSTRQHRSGSAPVRATPPRCADRSRRDARGSACSRRQPAPRPAGRDSGCNGADGENSAPLRTSKHLLVADMAQ